MGKKRRILYVALLAAVLGGLAWVVLRTTEPPEPVYQGKRLGFWLHNLLNAPQLFVDGGKTAEEAQQARKAVRQIGTNAIPVLLRMVRAKDSELKLKLMALLEKQSWIKIEREPDSMRNVEGAIGFKILGTVAKDAVPALVEIYQQDVSWASEEATAESLGSIGPAAKGAMPVLLRKAESTNVQTRRDAVMAILQINAEPETVVPAMIRALHDADLSVRWNAAIVLGDYGAAAQAAIPALLECLKDPNNGIEEQVRLALVRIDPGAAAKAGIK